MNKRLLLLVIGGIVVAVVALSVLTYVSGRANPAPSGPRPSPSTTPAGTHTPEPSPTVLPVGDIYTKPDGRATIAAFGGQTPSGHYAPEGEALYSVHVRVCISPSAPGGPWYVGTAFWSLLLKGGYSSTIIWSGDFGLPEYPANRTVTAGDCVDGWITFGLAPPDSVPVAIEYHNTDASPEIWVRWTL